MRYAVLISLCAGGSAFFFGLLQHGYVDALFVGSAVYLMSFGIFLSIFAIARATK